VAATLTLPMYVNAPSIVAALLSVAQAGFALMVVLAAARAVRVATRARTSEERDLAETERLRPAVPAAGLLVAALASWPLLIGVLDSYVGEWPTTMCIQGITQIGGRSQSAVRHLPLLLDVLFVTKPLLLFSAAAWIVAHGVSRRAPGRPGAHGPWLLLGLGTIAIVDAAAELAYLSIPKEDDVLATGCCMTTPAAMRSSGSSWLEGTFPSLGADESVVLLVGALIVLAAALTRAARRPVDRSPHPFAAWTRVLVVASVVGLLAQHVAIAVVSPAVHRVASHRCGWCVVERTTFGGSALGLLVLALGSCALAAFAALLERRNAAGGSPVTRRLARIALVGLLLAAILAALDAV